MRVLITYPAQEVLCNVWKEVKLIFSFICFLYSRILPHLFNQWSILPSCCREECIQISRGYNIQEPVREMLQPWVDGIDTLTSFGRVNLSIWNEIEILHIWSPVMQLSNTFFHFANSLVYIIAISTFRMNTVALNKFKGLITEVLHSISHTHILSLQDELVKLIS